MRFVIACLRWYARVLGILGYWDGRMLTCSPMKTFAKARKMAEPPRIQCKEFHVYLNSRLKAQSFSSVYTQCTTPNGERHEACSSR